MTVRPLRILPLCGLLLLAGCARVSGDVVVAGAPDVYSISERVSPLQGGARTAARTVIDRAQRFCAARGQRAVPLDSQQTGWPIQQDITGPTGFVMRFRCAPPGGAQMNVDEPG
jgi:hypothetical protein